MEASDREEDVKNGWRRGDLYNRGTLAVVQGDGEAASQALARANQQNPQNLYRQALAAQLRGDKQATVQWLQRTLDNNPLNNLNDSLVRRRAREMLDQFR